MNEVRSLPDSSIVLVAVLPSKDDLEISRLLGWYRIPLRFAPKVVQVDYLAFYQPSSFGSNHAARIEYFAEILGIELTTRKDLFSDQTDHPRADEEYYKLQIGPLKHLEEPILAGKWKRITFIYTTGSRFNRAKRISDLVIKDEERKILWRSLRDRAQFSASYGKNEYTDSSFNPDLLPFLNKLNDLVDLNDW